jgi:hypothetical protein
MPYITHEAKNEVAFVGPKTAGELNYLLTKTVLEYLGKKPNYQLFNDALGALEGCKLELYRRKVAPYEDIKIEQNGDVYR